MKALARSSLEGRGMKRVKETSGAIGVSFLDSLAGGRCLIVSSSSSHAQLWRAWVQD